MNPLQNTCVDIACAKLKRKTVFHGEKLYSTQLTVAASMQNLVVIAEVFVYVRN
jgi:queuine/archaeosine tRNA-ribosyltransferase